MESKYFNSFVFEIKLLHYKDIVDLQYKLLNILLVICYNNDYYSFCNKYHGCEKNYNFGRDLCALCRIKIYFWQDLMNFEENLNRNQYNLSKLRSYAFKLYPFLMECYRVDKRSLEAFSGHYVSSCRSR